MKSRRALGRWFALRICFPSLLLPLAALAATVPAKGPAPATPEVDAHSALLFDPASGRILYQKDPATPHPPASTVKLLTALLVYEHGGLNGNVTVEKADTEVEPSHIPLIPGETVSVHDLVYALLIGSDNDAAMALARHTSGSVPAFLALMNARAVQLGCTNSSFKSPNGLPMDGQYTTASDLLKIFQAVIAIPELRKICSTKEFHLTTQAGSRDIDNHNKLLGKYDGMGPAKTGWTVDSRHTYAAAVDRDSRELQLIVLDSKNKWNDAEELFDYGFAHLPLLKNSPNSPAAPKSSPSPAPIAAIAQNTTPTVVAAASPAPNPAPASAITLETYTVKKGDTLAAIAHHQHCTLNALLQANPQLSNPNLLKIGQVLTIP